MPKLLRDLTAFQLNFGTVVAESAETDLEKDVRMIRSFANLCTLILTKTSRINELEIIKKQEYISDLITWNFRSDQVAIKMGQDVGWDIVNKGIMVIVNLNNVQENININTHDLEKFINEILYKKIRDLVKEDNKRNLLGVRSDIFIILLENDSRNIYERANKLGRNLPASGAGY